MKKIWLTVAIVVLVVLALIFILTPIKREPGEIKIGAILPLTGAAAQYGTWAKNAMQIAMDEVNNAGGIKGKMLNILYEDSQTDPKAGVSAYRKLVATHKIKVVITEYSGLVLAIAPLAEKDKVIQLNIGALNPQIRQAGDYTFSNINDATVECFEMAKYAYNKLDIKKVSILHATSSAGVGAMEAFKQKFTELGGNIIAVEGFDEGDIDYRSQLIKIREGQPEAIYLPAFTREAALILKQALELGMKTQWLSWNGFEGADILRLAGKAAEGTIYSSTVLEPAPENPSIQRFVESYKRRYGQIPEVYAATAYDAVKIVSLAAKSVGYDGEKIKTFLYDVKYYPGVSGITTFDKDGQVNKPVLFRTVKEGKFLTLER